MADLSKTLITGAGGKIGRHLDFGFKSTREELDVLSLSDVNRVLNKVNPSCVLSLSSVNLRDSEQNPLKAFQVNLMGAYNLAKETAKRNIPFIYISTGAVFSGSKEKEFCESDTPYPLNIYGMSKYQAELMACLVNPRTVVLRTGWLFGGRVSPLGALDNILSKIKDDLDISVTDNHFGSPTYLNDFIDCLKRVILAEEPGIFHVVNEGSASATEFARECYGILRKPEKMHVTSLENHSPPYRSESEVLKNTKIEGMRHWRKALNEAI